MKMNIFEIFFFPKKVLRWGPMNTIIIKVGNNCLIQFILLVLATNYITLPLGDLNWHIKCAAEHQIKLQTILLLFSHSDTKKSFLSTDNWTKKKGKLR